MAGLIESVRTGWQAAWAAYTGKVLIPRDNNGYDTKQSRFSRYKTLESYADNEMYSTVNAQGLTRRIQNSLYGNIRAIMNACPRVVDLFAYYVYVGNIDMEHLTGGAIPIVTDDETVREAIRQVFKWSNWNALKELFVRNGATYGDSAIKVVDDPEHEKVYIEPLHPGRIREAELDSRGNVVSIVIEYDRDEELPVTVGQVGAIDLTTVGRQTYCYTEIITRDHVDATGKFVKGKFRTFKNKQPFAYYKDESGKMVAEWDNDYGFVPVVLVQHTNTGLKWGANAYYKVLRKIDELNDVTSLLHDQIRKVIIPLLAAIGVSKKRRADGTSDLEMESATSGNGRDTINMVFMPKDTDLKPVTTTIDIAAVNGNNLTISGEIEADLPILALQQIRRGGGDLTQPGIEAAYSDAVASINAARSNYDHGTVRALQMAISIGGYSGYSGFESFTLASYDMGRLDFTIQDRAVISVGISKDAKLTALGTINSMTPALQKVALKELNYGDDVIDEVMAAAEEATRNAVKGAMAGIFGDPTGANGGSSKPPQMAAGQTKQQLLAAQAGN